MFGRIATAMFVLVAGSCATSAANLTWDEWVISLKGAVVVKDEGAITMIRFRDDFCTSDRLSREKKVECGNRVNDVVLRLVEEKKTLLDIITKAQSSDKQEREKARIVNEDFVSMNTETKRRTDSVLEDFRKQEAMAK